MRSHLMFAMALAVGLGGSAQAQTPAPPSTGGTSSPAFVHLSGFSNDYQVGAGDLLEIQIVGHADLNQTLRISNSGEISFPMLGLIPVVDLTVFDVEAAVASRLRDKNLLQQPEVLVSVREFQAKPIYVSGAVVNPGQFIMSQDLTAADAILLAGGLQFNAADEGLLHRRTTTEGESGLTAADIANPSKSRPGVEIIKVNLEPMKGGRFLEAAIPLRQGDVLVVPEQNMSAFYVVGEVITPMNYFYAPQRVLMASQAVSMAGGPTPTAKMSDGMLVRYDKQGNRKQVEVDYAAILRGKQDDFPIEPNDIIFIPGSKVKTIGQGLLMLTDTMVMTASFRVARTYQMPDAPVRTPTQ